MKFLILLIIAVILISGCVQQTKISHQGSDQTKPIEEKTVVTKSGFSCENDNSVKTRGYVLLMGLADHEKEGWIIEKNLMEQDSKAKFVLIYDQDENLHLQEISDKFLENLNGILEKNPVEELVIFGASAGGVTASFSIPSLNFSGPVALHTLSSPLKGYDFRGIGEAFLGERAIFEKEIALGLEPFAAPGKNVKAYHHKTVTDTILKDYYCGSFASLCDPIKIQNNNIQGSKEFYYPQYDHNSLMGPVIRKVLECYNPNINQTIEEEELVKEKGEALGSLCAGEENCLTFCHNQKGRCMAYCDTDPENPMCQKPFVYDCSFSPEKPVCQKIRAGLENIYNSLKAGIENSIRYGPKYAESEYNKILKGIDDLRLRGYNKEKIEELKEKARSNIYTPATNQTVTPQPSPQPKYPENFYNPNIPCTNNPDVKFTNSVVSPDYVGLIVPMGAVTHDEITTHTYIFIGNRTAPVYIPVDSALTEIFYSGRDYGMTFQASCEFVYIFGHITDPVESIKQAVGTEQRVETQIKFKAGDILGQTSGTQEAHGFDFGAYHKNQANYYVNKARYETSWKFYNAVCPYDYFDSQTKNAYYSRFGGFGGIIPGASCGSASQDKAGTISGNWHDTQNIEWNPSHKKVAFGMDGDSAVRIMMTSKNVFFVFNNNPTFKKPKEITGEHCYSIDKINAFVYVKIISNTEMKMYVDETTKTCPSKFPEEKATTYYR